MAFVVILASAASSAPAARVSANRRNNFPSKTSTTPTWMRSILMRTLLDCVPTPNHDECDPDRVCCNGSCAIRSVLHLDFVCARCGCQIEDRRLRRWDSNPDNPCQIAIRTRPTHLVTKTDDTTCGEIFTQVCCGGICCAETQCCGLDGACEDCECLIEEVLYADGEAHPTDECFGCDVLLDPIAWSPISGEPCGENEHQFCCDGHCCEAHTCCSLANVCIPCRCIIGELTVDIDVLNPAKNCEICNPFMDSHKLV